MRFFMTLSVCFFLLASLAAAAAIDGKWVSVRQMERDGQAFTITQTFDLKSDGNKLTGTLSMAFGDMEPRSGEIKDGKVDGDKFSFSFTMSTPNGDFKVVYEGAVAGDTLKGTAVRDGGEPRPFEAKRK
ncbi:MAG: hypothetical protein GYA21_19200 [Myxococcales bacterium]|nr:hypothetical protein [Myxococcales bacterium]